MLINVDYVDYTLINIDGGKTITDAIILQLQNAHFSFPNVRI
jgi:hypothetical protein